MYEVPPPPAYIYTFSRTPIAGIVKFPIEKEQIDAPYHQLTCTDQDKATIHEIVITVADHGKFSLLLKKSHLDQLGVSINHVHPLKFLSTIFTSPRLKDRMYDIFSDYFKRSSFMDGLTPRLSREADKGRLQQYAEDFATEVNIPVEAVNHFFRSRDWENLVRYLIKQ